MNTQILNIGKTEAVRTNLLQKKNLRSTKESKVMSFEEKVLKHQDLVVVEMNLPVPFTKNKEMIPFKKNDKINSYLSKGNQRQNLTIPELPKVRKPVDISKNIIETKVSPVMIGVNIQSDEFQNVNLLDSNNKNTNNIIYNRLKANNETEFNLYLDKNTKSYVADTMDIDNTNNINTNNFLPQKIGKDEGTQIDDGDLFNFDIDVEPLLMVVTNKILEQAQLELMEEYEIKTLRDVKNKFNKRIQEEKARVKKVELEEINRKKDIEGLKKIKFIDKMNKVLSQQKLLSRVTSKVYLQGLKTNTLNQLSRDNMFNNYSFIISQETALKHISDSSKQMVNFDNNLDNALEDLDKEAVERLFIAHKSFLQERREKQNKQKEEESKLQLIAEEEARKAKIEREKRRNIKRIKKLRNDIKENIIKIAQIKGEFHTEEYIFGPSGSENLDIKSFNEDVGSYVSVFGGLITQYLACMSVLKYEIFPINDSYFNNETLLELISTLVSESGRIILRLKVTCENEVKKNIHYVAKEEKEDKDDSQDNNEQSEFNIRNLKENTSFSKEDWSKMADILCKFEYCAEEYLINVVNLLMKEEENKVKDKVPNTNKITSRNIKLCYESIVKCLILLLEKGNDKVVLNFIDPISSLDSYFKNHFNRKAFVLITPSDNFEDVLENAEYIKDKRYKKLKTPIIDTEAKRARVYTPTVNHVSPIDGVDYGYKVLFEDVNAEVFLSLRFLETFFKIIITKYEPDIECKTIYVRYIEEFLLIMKQMREKMNLSERILYFEIPIFEENEKEDEKEIEADMGN